MKEEGLRGARDEDGMFATEDQYRVVVVVVVPGNSHEIIDPYPVTLVSPLIVAGGPVVRSILN